MKYSNLPSLFLFCCTLLFPLFLFSKPTSNFQGMPEMKVSKYVQLLKSGKYKEFKLPAFSPEDIPELLEYAKDLTLIKNYPVNPLSSFKGPDRHLGFIILWTIENIRQNYPYENQEKSILRRYPSLNPMVNKVGKRFKDLNSPENLQILAGKYQLWWEKEVPFAKLRRIDPMADSGFVWR